MSSAQSKLDSIEVWFDFQNAQHDAKMDVRPNWWHAGKIALGLVALGKAFAFAIKATGIGGYALAIVLFVGGLALTIEGGRILIESWLAKQS